MNSRQLNTNFQRIRLNSWDLRYLFSSVDLAKPCHVFLLRQVQQNEISNILSGVSVSYSFLPSRSSDKIATCYEKLHFITIVFILTVGNAS